MHRHPLFVPYGQIEHGVEPERDHGEETPHEESAEQFSRFAGELQRHTDDLGVSALVPFPDADGGGHTERDQRKEVQTEPQEEILSDRPGETRL